MRPDYPLRKGYSEPTYQSVEASLKRTGLILSNLTGPEHSPTILKEIQQNPVPENIKFKTDIQSEITRHTKKKKKENTTYPDKKAVSRSRLRRGTNNRITGQGVKTAIINVLNLLKEVKNKQKPCEHDEERNRFKRDPYQTSSSELTWKSVGFTLTEKRKGYTWRKVFPIWCFSFFQVVMWLTCIGYILCTKNGAQYGTWVII